MEFEILPVTRFQQNCSILWCEKTHRAAVIDPGGDLSEILNFIELLELTPEVALVTHGHFDHCGGAAQFAALTGSRIEGPHFGDAPLIERLPQQSAYYAQMARARLAGEPNGGEEIVERLQRYSEQTSAGVRSYQPARWLEHGDTIRFGEQELEVLHCPGHSMSPISAAAGARPSSATSCSATPSAPGNTPTATCRC